MYNPGNGRINILEPSVSTKFSMMDKIPVNTNSNYLNSLTGNFERNLLSDTYFSRKNIEYIQSKIKEGVYLRSNRTIKIDNQSEEQVVIVMRSYFLQYSKNLDTDIQGQINVLNKYVLDYCINNVYNEAVSYIKYREDASNMYKPMTAPIYSSKTNKTLENKPWF